jgi:transposase
MTRTVRKYTEEFKQEAVNLAIKLPSITQAAKELGIPIGTLHTWIYQLQGKDKPVNISSTAKSNQPDMAALLEENRRLHKENVILKEEREILKKAASYFAQHQK